MGKGCLLVLEAANISYNCWRPPYVELKPEVAGSILLAMCRRKELSDKETA